MVASGGGHFKASGPRQFSIIEASIHLALYEKMYKKNVSVHSRGKSTSEERMQMLDGPSQSYNRDDDIKLLEMFGCDYCC